jgi:hypothetical protein
MIGIKLLRRGLAWALLPAVMFPPGARAAPAEAKPVWTFATTTAGTLNFTNYAFSTKGQANGKKFEVSLQCRRYHGDKAETIDLDFSADLASGKPFKFDRLAYRRDLEKMPSYIHQPAILAEDPLFTVRTHGFATAITIARGRYAADKNDLDKKVWSETTREWTASGGSEKPAKAIFNADGTFREDPLWIDALYSVGAENTPSEGAQANLVWEAKIDLTGIRDRAEKLVTLCGITE